MVAFLNKSEGSEDFHQIIDFVNLSHIKYALTENLTIYTFLIKQFWETASTSTLENEEMEITATIHGRVKTIRRHIKLEDSDGITTLPNAEIFEQLALMGPKKTAWEQFSSNIATAIICLATNRTFNFSKMIFEEEPTTMPHDSSQPRVQSLGSDEGSLTLNELTVLYTTLSKKVEDLQNYLKQTKLTYGAAYTKLILRVKKLEHKVKASKSRRRARVIISDNEEDVEDSYKQWRIIAKINENPSISLVQDEGTSWIQEDAETHGRTSADIEILLEQEEPTELVEDPGSGEKGEKEISTVGVSTTKAVLSAIIPEINEEERQRIARDAEIPKQLQEEIDIARQEQEKYDLAQALELQKDLDKRNEGVAETTQAHDIDWSDPAVIRYHAQQNRSFSKAEVQLSTNLHERKKEYSEEELKKLLVIVPVEEVYIEALQVYQVFEDMLKRFDRDDLEKLWDLVRKKFSSTEPTVDKEKVVVRTSADTEILLEQEEPTELVEDPGSGEKAEKEISTANISISLYSKECSKEENKGKAIMKDDESVQKKTKKQLEQERLGHEEAIRLQEQIYEEERQRIARDAEIAKLLQEEIDIARQEQEMYDLAQALELQKELDKRKEGVAETTQAHDIDWSDPAVLRYHAQQNRSFSKAEVRKNMCMYLKNQGGYKKSYFRRMSYEDIRPIFERVWDQNQSFIPKDSKIEKEVMKRSGFDFQKPPAKRQKDLVKKKFSSTETTVDKEKVLWVELKRLFEPDDDDTLWKLQRYMHDPLKWKLYESCVSP
ncbi:hypothetical protein Tco_0698535 [Tanacetum coccineum]